jgi:hypothetical protein
MWRNIIAVALVLVSFPAIAKKGHPFTGLNCTTTTSSSFFYQNGAWTRDDNNEPAPFVIDSINNATGTAILRGADGAKNTGPSSASAAPDYLALTISHAGGRLIFSSSLSTSGEDEYSGTITVFTGYQTPIKTFPVFEHISALSGGLQITSAGLCLPIYDTAAQPAPSPTVQQPPSSVGTVFPTFPNAPVQQQQPVVAPATAPPDDGQFCAIGMRALAAGIDPFLKQAILEKLRNRGCLR